MHRHCRRIALLGVLTGLGGVLNVSSALACPSPTRPYPDDQYPIIVLGEVVGVRLPDDYAAQRRKEVDNPSLERGYSDASEPYEVEIIAVEVFPATAPRPVTLMVPMGCAIPVPELQQFGLFYVNSRGEAIPVYQDAHDYEERLERLGSRSLVGCHEPKARRPPDPCWQPSRR